MPVKKGDKIKVEYQGTLDDGTVFDESKRVGKPLEFEVGAGQVIRGFDLAVDGMELNESKTVKIKADDAYGQYNPELLKEVPKEHMPTDKAPEKGMMLTVTMPTGQQVPATISDVKDKVIILDFNHPLAGKDLTFEIKVVGIN